MNHTTQHGLFYYIGRVIVIIASHPKQIMSQKALYSLKGFRERL